MSIMVVTLKLLKSTCTYMLIDIYKGIILRYFMYKKDLNVEMDDERTSRINAAGIINITLENLWRDCYNSMAKGDLVTWNRKLDAIWVLLGGDVKKGDENDKYFQQLDMKIHGTGGLNHKKTGFGGISGEENVIIAKQYILLREKSLFLRRLQNSQGKGTAYATDDGDWE